MQCISSALLFLRAHAPCPCVHTHRARHHLRNLHHLSSVFRFYTTVFRIFCDLCHRASKYCRASVLPVCRALISTGVYILTLMTVLLLSSTSNRLSACENLEARTQLRATAMRVCSVGSHWATSSMSWSASRALSGASLSASFIICLLKCCARLCCTRETCSGSGC